MSYIRKNFLRYIKTFVQILKMNKRTKTEKLLPKRPKTKYKFYTDEMSRHYGELHTFSDTLAGAIEVPVSTDHLIVERELAAIYGIKITFGFRTHVWRNALVREFLQHCSEHPLAQQLASKIEASKQNQTVPSVITE